MAAVAREFPPPPRSPRLVPPRPTPKSSVPPPLPQTTAVDEDEILDLSDTAVHELVLEDEPAPKSAPAIAAPAAIERGGRTSHPGVILLRTFGFFVAQLTGDAFRCVRAYVKAHWLRASARARG
jgi:hypothetical protein